MDIQGWLQGTADRAPPNPSDEPDALTFVQAAHSVETAKATRYRRKRQRAATDSSIIAPHQKAGNRSKAGGQSAGVDRGRHVHTHPPRSESANRGASSRPASQEHGTDARMRQPDSKTYERRARHKTKPDRYESKTMEKGQRKRHGSVDGRKPKRKSRHVHRGGDGKRTESLVQGFRLKNGPSNSRLTLKPDAGAGMFRHGRASAQLAGRSNGLPDLAFNELKFLRESNEHQDENRVHDNMRKPSNQERKRDVEREEISAYFDQQNQKRDSAPDGRQTRKPNLVDDEEILADHQDVRERGSSPRIPDGELTAIPHLGFGSKGTISKAANPPPSITSYLPWSESDNGFAAPERRKPAFETALEVDQLTVSKPNTVRRSRRDNQTIPANDATKRPSQLRIDVPKRQGTTPRRIRVPAHINVYTDLGVTESNSSTEMRRLRDSQSQSLLTERSRKSTRDQRKRALAADHMKALSSGDESFHTSDILKIRSRLQSLAEHLPSESKSTHEPSRDKENVPPPSSSSPMAKILRTAHGAMMQNYLEIPLQLPVKTRESNTFDSVQREHPSCFPAAVRHQLEHDLRDPAEENYEHPGIVNSASLMGHYVEQQACRDMRDVYGEEVEPDDEEMLDTYAVGEPQQHDIENGARQPRYAYCYSTLDMRSDVRSMSQQAHRPSTRQRDMPWSRGDTATVRIGTSSHNMLTEQDVSTRGDRIVDQEFVDGLEGFWRPNRLY